MEIIDNTSKTLRDDLSKEIKEGSKLSIAAACFSIYAFQELKKELKGVDELRFIFTSPTFITEKAKKGKQIGRPTTTADALPRDFWRTLKLYQQGTITVSDMARMLNCSRTTIYKYMDVAGIQR